MTMSDMTISVTTVIKDQVLELRINHDDDKYKATLYIDEEPVEVDYYGVSIDASTISAENFVESTSAQHDMREYISLALDISEKQATTILDNFVVGIKKEQEIHAWCKERAKLETAYEAGKFDPTYTNLNFKPDTSVPNFEPEYKPEPTNGISAVKSDSGDTRYNYPVISVNADIDGVAKEIGVKIIFEKRVFGTSLWFTELLVNGEVTDESRSEEAFVVSKKAQTDIGKFIIRALALSTQQAEEIILELLSFAKKQENEILSMDKIITNVKTETEKALEGLEGDDKLKAILNIDEQYQKYDNDEINLQRAKMFMGNNFYDKSSEEAFKFIDSHLKDHYGFNDKEIKDVNVYCSKRIKDNNFRHNHQDSDDKTEGKEAESEDSKRVKIAEAIMKAKLHLSTEERLAELAESYGTPIDTIRDMFYDCACAINFNTAKDIKGEVKRALEKLHFTCHNKFNKQENVTFGDAGAQFLYNKIKRVVISKGVDLVDIPNWEFWFDDQIDGKKIILPATALNTMLAFDKLYLATFSRPAPILKKVVWRELLEELYEHKAKEVLDTDDSDVINVTKIIFEKICEIPVTTDDIEQVVTGQALHEFKGAYYITSKKIEEIREEMRCGFTTRKINEALVGLKYKEKGTEQHYLGKKQHRCWKIHKDAVDQRNKEHDLIEE